jgi:hypothetical protein
VRTAHAVCGSEVSPALSGARKSVKFGVVEDSDGGGNDGSVVFAGGSV